VPAGRKSTVPQGEGGSPIRLRHALAPALAPALCVAALVFGLLAYGTWRCQQLRADGRPADGVTAGLVQADISQYGRLASELGTFEAVRRILDAHFALSSEALGRAAVDFLMWPETVYPTTFGSPKSEEGAAFDREIGGFVTSTGVPLVFGAYDAEGEDEFNAAVFLEPAPDGRVTFDTYRKASLFPLTERVPAVLESDLVRGWLPWLGTWKPGRGAQVLPLRLRDRTLLIAPLICYDDVDANLVIAAVRQGAELIVTLSNDVWFGFGPASYGHLVIAAFRSIETRRPQLRVTNTGISAVISPTGEFVTTAGVHQRAALVATVTPERRATTLMLLWGGLVWAGHPRVRPDRACRLMAAKHLEARVTAAGDRLTRQVLSSPDIGAVIDLTAGTAAAGPAEARRSRAAGKPALRLAAPARALRVRRRR
jgi:apolipoprotein N-acyltransferase